MWDFFHVTEGGDVMTNILSLQGMKVFGVAS